MALLTAQVTTLTGLEPTFTAASAGGDTFATTGKELLYIKNAGAATRTVTVNDPNTTGPTGAKAFDADVDIVIPAGEERVAGPFTAARFRDTADNEVHMTYSSEADLTLALIRPG